MPAHGASADGADGPVAEQALRGHVAADLVLSERPVEAEDTTPVLAIGKVGSGAVTMNSALMASMTTLPESCARR